jgi:hypothetical protein
MMVAIAIGSGLGLLLGLGNVALLRANVRLYLSGRGSRAIALHVGRLAGVVVGLGIAVRVGAAALIAATLALSMAGFVAARREVR